MSIALLPHDCALQPKGKGWLSPSDVRVGYWDLLDSSDPYHCDLAWDIECSVVLVATVGL